jgi:hypothetical protein
MAQEGIHAFVQHRKRICSTDFPADVELAHISSASNGLDWGTSNRYQQEQIQIFHVIATRTLDARAWSTGTATRM